MEGMKDILKDMLEGIVKSHPNEYRTAFELLVKLLSNIIEHPGEEKYTVFKKTNEIIKSKIMPITEIVDVLNMLGYEEGTGENENCMIYKGESNESLKDCIDVLKEILSSQTSSSANASSGYKVVVYQYDLTQGMARAMSLGFIGKQIDGVWHTAVCVYGKEYFYGGGICVGEPKKTPYGYPVKEIDFGYTNKTQAELQTYLDQIDSKYNVNTYDILNCNCNHFTDAALFFLTGKHLPNSILKQHEEILNTPMGQMFRPILENMSKKNNAFLPNMVEGRK